MSGVRVPLCPPPLSSKTNKHAKTSYPCGYSSVSLCAGNAENARCTNSGSVFSYKTGVIVQRNIRALLVFAFLLLALPMSARADSASVSLPDAPMIVRTATVHHDFDRFDYAIYAGVVGYRIGDYVTTERALSRGAVEGELPKSLVASKPAFLTYSLTMAAGEIAASVWLHKHGHPRLARAADTLSVASGVAVDVHNNAVAQGAHK